MATPGNCTPVSNGTWSPAGNVLTIGKSCNDNTGTCNPTTGTDSAW